TIFDELLRAQEYYINLCRTRNNEKTELRNNILKYERDLKALQTNYERIVSENRKLTIRINDYIADNTDKNEEIKIVNQQLNDKNIEIADNKRSFQSQINELNNNISSINEQLNDIKQSNNQLA